MAVSQSGQIIARLVAQGVSRAAIGEALGRDRSLISQVARGVKPGNNLQASLEQLERRLTAAAPATPREARDAARQATVPAPARRTSRAGFARVRRPVTKGRADRWTASEVKRQGIRSGGKSLLHPTADAADNGKTVAVTISFDKGLSVSRSYGKRGRSGRGGAVEMKLGAAGDVMQEVATQYGGNFAEYLAAEAQAAGFVSGALDTREVVQHMAAVELRSF